MVKIAFYNPIICVRGTSVALFDYAKYNQEILGNKSIIITPESRLAESDPYGLVHFARNFTIKTHSDMNDLDRILIEEKCDLLYVIKYGTNDGIFSKKVKTVIHCVFDMSYPHGDVYAGVSRALAAKFGQTLFVPHMVGLKPSTTKENLRKALNIPETAIVFGRYGGLDTFNIEFCWEVIFELVNQRSNMYFLFINTPMKISHPRIIYLDKITEEDDKNRFICTCDAHIECGTLGHSFGLTIAEFSVNNKPIITWKPEPPNFLWNTAHLEILGDRGIYYKDKEEFKNILSAFNPADYKDKDMNCYTDYTPEKVMKIFDKVFIQDSS